MDKSVRNVQDPLLELHAARARGPSSRAPVDSHHAGAVAVLAVLDLGAGLVTPAVATLTRGLHVDRDLFVDALRRLGEGQLHDVLRHKQRARR